MNHDDVIRTRYPYLLAKRYETVKLEVDPQLRVHKLIELFEETVRYLALVGLAQYNFIDLTNEDVERDRQGLARPSLGHWLQLMFSIASALEEKFELLSSPLNQVYKQGTFFDAVQTMAAMIGKEVPNKVRLKFYLETLVEFRNKKIGHGSILPWEAKQVVDPLTDSLSDWLINLSILQNYQLVYIDKVEWTGDNFVFIGHNLSFGTSIYPIKLSGDEPVHPNRIYLGEREESNKKSNLLPLHPFFAYNQDFAYLYIFNELSSKELPLLRCFYAQQVNFLEQTLEVDRELVLGEQILA